MQGGVRDAATTVSLNQTESTTLLFSPIFIGSVCFLKVQPPQICTGFHILFLSCEWYSKLQLSHVFEVGGFFGFFRVFFFLFFFLTVHS